jgi:phosphoribosylglycinamide formyltransferase-1
MIKIEIWASGGGTNADKIISYFNKIPNINVVSLGCDRKDAGSFKVAKKHGIKSIYWDKKSWEISKIIHDVEVRSIDFIVLAGFLKLVPNEIIERYEGRIINIHPSLLPSYGGKNMYGDYVHQAVINNKEPKSGISIHEVNEEFDKGKILAQFSVNLDINDDVESLKSKIQYLEHKHFSSIIHSWIKSKSL